MFWFRPGRTQTRLYSYRRRLEILDLDSREIVIIYVAKTKVLISLAVTAKLNASVFSHMQNVCFLMTQLKL